MNLLDRYIFKSVLAACAGAVALFAFVMTLGNVIRDMLGYVLSGQLSFTLAAELIALTVASVATYALPMGILTGVLLTLGRLSADNVITAMRVAGISLGRIARPVMILGALGVATGLFINFESMPWAKLEYERRLADAVRANPLSFIVPKTFIREFPNAVIYVNEEQGPVLRDVWVWKLDNERRVHQLVRAESGRVDFDDASNELIVTLTNALVEDRDEKNPEEFSLPSHVFSVAKWGPQRLSVERLFGRGSGVKQKLDWMTFRELSVRFAQLEAQAVPPEQTKEHAREITKVRLTVQNKINLAVAALSFALIGVPLGIRVSRRETSANLGVAVILAVSYYVMTVMIGWLDGHPEYRPDLLLWVPNLIFFGLGIRMFTRIGRG